MITKYFIFFTLVLLTQQFRLQCITFCISSKMTTLHGTCGWVYTTALTVTITEWKDARLLLLLLLFWQRVTVFTVIIINIIFILSFIMIILAICAFSIFHFTLDSLQHICKANRLCRSRLLYPSDVAYAHYIIFTTYFDVCYGATLFFA